MEDKDLLGAKAFISSCGSAYLRQLDDLGTAVSDYCFGMNACGYKLDSEMVYEHVTKLLKL